MTLIDSEVFHDELSNAIFELLVVVNAQAAEYYTGLFSTDGTDEFAEAMAVFEEEGLPALDLLGKALLNGIQAVDLPSEMNPVFRDLLSRKFFGRPASTVVMECRYAILMTCAFSAECNRHLGGNNVISAVDAYGNATYQLGSCAATLQSFYNEGSIGAVALSGALSMLSNSPKQKDKSSVRECWDEWQKSPLNRDGTTKYAGKTAFVKDMLTKYESLESVAVISRWCLAWEKELITQLAE
jgi:hypothetical protein